MPYDQTFKMHWHLTRFFTVDGKHFEITGTVTEDNGDTTDIVRDAAGEFHRIPRTYFVGKQIEYTKTSQVQV